jgi:hypothetical protein
MSFGFTCSGLQPAEQADPICPKENSWLCEQSEKLGITLEDTYGWIYSASATAALFNAVDRKEICKFTKDVGEFYDKRYPLSYAGIIAEIATQIKLIDDPEKALLLSNILNQNLRLYSNTQIISMADDEIIRIGYHKYREEMLCRE